jgi:hypothetical protein
MVLVVAVAAGALCGGVGRGREIDMRPYWDERAALENPDKGWYHHYPDNHVNKYVIGEDADLVDFPGMDHLYVRLAWAYLEPQEGKYDWAVIDRIIDKWVGHGLGIAFRISCKETSTDRIEQQFATPRWVMQAGAKGDFYRSGRRVGPDGPWEPVFDDPIFLEKLENFLRAFAARYDGKPWLRYVDVGSIGDWGEGHLHSGSRLEYGYEPRKQHIDLHLKYFKNTQLVVSDDFVYAIEGLDDRERMHRYIVAEGLTYRDDSILVNYYIGAYPESFTVRSPELFADVWRDRPTVLELEHYRSVRRLGNWTGEAGSLMAEHGGGRKGPDFFRGALALLHATYIGYHGLADVWLAENPELTVELLNRCGYWFFLHSATVPESVRPGRPCTVHLAWENRGVAPPYQPYTLRLRLAGAKIADFEFDAGNRRWLPEPVGRVYRESHTVAVPPSLPPGTYMLKLKLYAKGPKRDVLLALDRHLLDEDNFYRIASVEVRR